MKYILFAVFVILAGLAMIPLCGYDATGGLFIISLGIGGILTEISERKKG